VRRLVKLVHALGAAGMIGGGLALAVLLFVAREAIGTPGYITALVAMAKLGAWIIGPSVLATVGSGVLSIAVTPAFQDAGWVWVKAATGIAVFEGSLLFLGPIQTEAKRAAGGLADGPDLATLAHMLRAEGNTLWVILAVSFANVVLGVWRPRLPEIPV